MDPFDAWRGNDAADRQGITEIKHVTGLSRLLGRIASAASEHAD